MAREKKLKIPSPLEIAIFLTLFVWLLATVTTDHGLKENLNFWGRGLWSLLTFMTQMCLILLGGSVVASSKPVHNLLGRVAKWPKNSFQVYLFSFWVSAATCWLNWGLGLVAGAFFAREVARSNRKAHFPLVVAASYMGFIFWHGGLSGSIPLTVGTPDNFSMEWLGELIPFGQTVFTCFNLLLILSLLFSLSALLYFFSGRMDESQAIPFIGKEEGAKESLSEELTIYSFSTYLILIVMMVIFLGAQIVDGSFRFGLNQINFVLILLGLLLHRNLKSYMESVHEACGKLGPILIQYPLYAGIMGIMINSGLAVKISDGFVAISSQTTYPLFMFLSAGLVNLFVPSGGGQWAVQAPVVVQGAKELGVPLWKVVMAVAWGDAWTNLAQPFWALPLLSIVGLKIKDIMYYCLSALIVSGIVISIFFLAF